MLYEAENVWMIGNTVTWADFKNNIEFLKNKLQTKNKTLSLKNTLRYHVLFLSAVLRSKVMYNELHICKVYNLMSLVLLYTPVTITTIKIMNIAIAYRSSLGIRAPGWLSPWSVCLQLISWSRDLGSASLLLGKSASPSPTAPPSFSCSLSLK